MALSIDELMGKVFDHRQTGAPGYSNTLLWSVFRWLSARTSGADQGHPESPHIMWKQHADQRNAVPLDYAGMTGNALTSRFMCPKSGRIIKITMEVEGQ